MQAHTVDFSGLGLERMKTGTPRRLFIPVVTSSFMSMTLSGKDVTDVNNVENAGATYYDKKKTKSKNAPSSTDTSRNSE